MSQEIFDDLDPEISGTELAGVMNLFKDAIASGFSGTDRPVNLQAGGYWVDTTNDPTSWTLKLYTGTTDVDVVTIDLVNETAGVSNAVDSFTVQKVSADTVGAIFNLVKRRVANNGQVLSGDVVGRIRFQARDNSGVDNVVGEIVWEAGENQTTSAYGGTLVFRSTPTGASAMVDHMRFINGQVEMLVPHKITSQVLGSQNISTTATIVQLNADKALAEMTGSTTTDIQGINSSDDSKVITIHNRSTASVHLRNQNAGAIAADRLKLPEGRDIELLPEESATLFYCTTDSRWKLKASSAKFEGFTKDTVYEAAGSWAAPSTVSKVRLVAHQRGRTTPARMEGFSHSKVMDVGGKVFAFGRNTHGELGVGDVTPRSSPVAVLSAMSFTKLSGNKVDGFDGNVGISEDGSAYAWGYNAFGQLGVGDVLPRSSPVAVLGGFKFRSIAAASSRVLAIAADGTPYAWGFNDVGQLGLGDVTPRSSPIAVLGGLKFREVYTAGFSSFGLTFNNDLYAWGFNTNGELGVGDTTVRSSPVAVVGGLKFKKIVTALNSVYGLTTDNDLYAWGVNSDGQLGVGDVIPRSSPVAVLGGLKFQDITTDPALGTWVLGLTTAGTPYAWGINAVGMLGVNDIIPRSSPVAVVGGLTFRKIFTTHATGFGITEDGDVYAWGAGINGELGDNAFVNRSSPVLVVGGYSFKELSCVRSLTQGAILGLAEDGKLYAWGSNAHGQLGLGDVVYRSSPVLVLGGLSLRTQDDSTVMLDIDVNGGDTYALKIGNGPCFFGAQPIGNDVESVEISYIE